MLRRAPGTVFSCERGVRPPCRCRVQGWCRSRAARRQPDRRPLFIAVAVAVSRPARSSESQSPAWLALVAPGRAEPFPAYGVFDFGGPYMTGGDCYARFLVRMEEMRQGVRTLQQAIENPPAGPVNVPIAEKFPLPDKGTTYNSM